MMRRRMLLAALVAVVWTVGGLAMPAQAGPSILGAGSTWAAIALGQWQVDAAKQGMSINYQAVGSTAGRQLYIIKQVDFAATEIPFLPDEINQLHSEGRSYQYLPDVAGGTAFMYNLKDTSGHQITKLRLSATTAAAIFTGRISNWSDPAIKADNPGLALPNESLRPVIRSDGSGTSAKLADYLAHMAPSIWNPFAHAHGLSLPVQFWPNFPRAVAVRGSDGVANFISSKAVGNGAIGYVEAGYVYEHSFTPVYLKNRSGYYAGPSSYNDAVALTHATLNDDLTQNLGGVYAAPEKNAYPLASYSYLVTQTTGMDPAKGAVLGRWIIYIACAGQKEAAPLGYSPLPKNLIQDVFDAVGRIPGAPATPPITAAGCPNPTVTGQGFGGGPGDSSVLPPGPLPGGDDGTSGSGGGGTTGGTGTGGTGTGTESPLPGSTIDPVTGALLGSGAQLTAAQLGVTPLTDAEKQASYQSAVQASSSATPSSAGPLVFAVAGIGLLLLVPLLMRPRAHAANGPPGPGPTGPPADGGVGA
jgi:phosphate transport system substrate-binding protein